jgi:hypothetical protein
MRAASESPTEKRSQVDSKIPERCQDNGAGRRFIQIADDGKVIRDNLQKTFTGIYQINETDKPG